MRIGVIGSGAVGQALGGGLAALGHEVKMGTREPTSDKAKSWLAKTVGKTSAGTFAEASAHSEVAILATMWAGTENALRLAGAKNLAGKVLVDATNPLDFSQGAPPRLALGHTDSGGEQVQRWVPDARVVKAFNIVGNAHMVKPQFPGGPPDMFICGNDASAKKSVEEICTALGWPVSDLGGIEAARYLEPLAMVWIAHGFRSGTWNHAFKLLRK
jgi:hypothetical protein